MLKCYEPRFAEVYPGVDVFLTNGDQLCISRVRNDFPFIFHMSPSLYKNILTKKKNIHTSPVPFISRSDILIICCVGLVL